MQTSSGGLFYLLSNLIIEKGGIIVGASFTNDFYSVEHIIVNNKNDLNKVLTSKYLQSYVKEDIYKKVRQTLKNNIYVLFSGTSCQISALKQYLGKDKNSEYLLCVDVICHGVPSPKL